MALLQQWHCCNNGIVDVRAVGWRAGMHVDLGFQTCTTSDKKVSQKTHNTYIFESLL